MSEFPKKPLDVGEEIRELHDALVRRAGDIRHDIEEILGPLQLSPSIPASAPIASAPISSNFRRRLMRKLRRYRSQHRTLRTEKKHLSERFAKTEEDLAALTRANGALREENESLKRLTAELSREAAAFLKSFEQNEKNWTAQQESWEKKASRVRDLELAVQEAAQKEKSLIERLTQALDVQKTLRKRLVMPSTQPTPAQDTRNEGFLLKKFTESLRAQRLLEKKYADERGAIERERLALTTEKLRFRTKHPGRHT